MKNIFEKPIAMKLFRVIGVLAFLFALSLIVQNCDGYCHNFAEDCNCPKTYKYEYSVSSFSIRNFEF